MAKLLNSLNDILFKIIISSRLSWNFCLVFAWPFYQEKDSHEMKTFISGCPPSQILPRKMSESQSSLSYLQNTGRYYFENIFMIRIFFFCSSLRELRNKAEKLRRDRLNSLMEEMRTLVPIICNKWVDSIAAVDPLAVIMEKLYSYFISQENQNWQDAGQYSPSGS